VLWVGFMYVSIPLLVPVMNMYRSSCCMCFGSGVVGSLSVFVLISIGVFSTYMSMTPRSLYVVLSSVILMIKALLLARSKTLDVIVNFIGKLSVFQIRTLALIQLLLAWLLLINITSG